MSYVVRCSAVMCNGMTVGAMSVLYDARQSNTSVARRRDTGGFGANCGSNSGAYFE
ncbi:hypothetical protein G893_01226 [Escherichia coli KOEGE 71 (186a)]|nr:hypothetical protein G893_01226 [Escherichia coli KOEGE 71 (186a)]